MICWSSVEYGGEFRDVVISELRAHYYAKLRVRHDGELVEIDSRPSDAIAVAVCATRRCRLRGGRRPE
jgi:bifunctional DNase/RNase